MIIRENYFLPRHLIRFHSRSRVDQIFCPLFISQFYFLPSSLGNVKVLPKFSSRRSKSSSLTIKSVGILFPFQLEISSPRYFLVLSLPEYKIIKSYHFLLMIDCLRSNFQAEREILFKLRNRTFSTC